MPRDSFGASNIGTFSCHTFPRETKASKRAKAVVWIKDGRGQRVDNKIIIANGHQMTKRKVLILMM